MVDRNHTALCSIVYAICDVIELTSHHWRADVKRKRPFIKRCGRSLVTSFLIPRKDELLPCRCRGTFGSILSSLLLTGTAAAAISSPPQHRTSQRHWIDCSWTASPQLDMTSLTTYVIRLRCSATRKWRENATPWYKSRRRRWKTFGTWQHKLGAL